MFFFLIAFSELNNNLGVRLLNSNSPQFNIPNKGGSFGVAYKFSLKLSICLASGESDRQAKKAGNNLNGLRKQGLIMDDSPKDRWIRVESWIKQTTRADFQRCNRSSKGSVRRAGFICVWELCGKTRCFSLHR